MKRDLDLIRQLLIEIEDAEPNETLTDIELGGYSKQAIKYHLSLLEEGGYIRANFAKTEEAGIIHYLVEDLTTKGHDWLAAARNETVWNKTKEVVKEKGGSFTFDVITKLLIKVGEDVAGL